jgi:hypothetical protein
MLHAHQEHPKIRAKVNIHIIEIKKEANILIIQSTRERIKYNIDHPKIRPKGANIYIDN